MTTPIYRRWCKRIDSNAFTMSECRQFAQAVLPLSEDLPAGGKRTNLEPHEARALRQRIWNLGGIRLDEATTKVGLDWLRRYGTKTLGIPAEAIDHFDHFTFEGDGHKGHPMFVLHTIHGREIEYHRVPWQAAHYDRRTSSPGSWHERKMVA